MPPSSDSFLGSGTYGCAFTQAAGCRTKSTTHGRQSRSGKTVSKILQLQYYLEELKLAQLIEQSIDPKGEFTPRLLGYCDDIDPATVNWGECEQEEACGKGKCGQLVYEYAGKDPFRKDNWTLSSYSKFVLQFARGLQAFYNAGYIHGDVKGDNVLVSDRDGEVNCSVIDFGFVSTFDEFIAERKSYIRSFKVVSYRPTDDYLWWMLTKDVPPTAGVLEQCAESWHKNVFGDDPALMTYFKKETVALLRYWGEHNPIEVFSFIETNKRKLAESYEVWMYARCVAIWNKHLRIPRLQPINFSLFYQNAMHPDPMLRWGWSETIQFLRNVFRGASAPKPSTKPSATKADFKKETIRELVKRYESLYHRVLVLESVISHPHE